jgi:hypothetical protein
MLSYFDVINLTYVHALKNPIKRLLELKIDLLKNWEH